MIIKIFTVLYPFLRELLLGKYSRDERFKSIKILFIIAALISFIGNWLLGKSLYTISSDRVEQNTQIEYLQNQIRNSACTIDGTTLEATSSNQSKVEVVKKTTKSTHIKKPSNKVVTDTIESDINARLNKLP